MKMHIRLLLVVIAITGQLACCSDEDMQQHLRSAQDALDSWPIDSTVHSSNDSFWSIDDIENRVNSGNQLVDLSVTSSTLLIVNVTTASGDAHSIASAIGSCDCTIRHSYHGSQEPINQDSVQETQLSLATEALLALNTVCLELLPPGAYQIRLRCSNAACQIQPAGFQFEISDDLSQTDMSQSYLQENASGGASSTAMHSMHSMPGSESSIVHAQRLQVHLKQHTASQQAEQRQEGSTFEDLSIASSPELLPPVLPAAATDATCDTNSSAGLHTLTTKQTAALWLLRLSFVSLSLLLMTRQVQSYIAEAIQKVRSTSQFLSCDACGTDVYTDDKILSCVADRIRSHFPWAGLPMAT